MGKPCPASKKKLQEKPSVSLDKVKEEDRPNEDSFSSDDSDCFEVVPAKTAATKRRSSGRQVKPVLKKVKYTDANSNSEEDPSEKSESEEEDDDEESDDSLPKTSRGGTGIRGRGRGSARGSTRGRGGRGASTGGRGRGTKPQKVQEKEKNTDDEYESIEDEEEEGSGSDDDLKKAKSKPKAKGGRAPYGAAKATNAGVTQNGKNNDDDEIVDYDNMKLDDDDEEDEFAKWKAPNYKDKEWFKKMCLLCQICKKMHETTGEALTCFHKHKDRLRCYLCFCIIKGGKNGTKRLYRHYHRNHEKGDKPNTNKCPHCNESFPYKSTSCHVIASHFREALGLPERPPHADQMSKKGGDEGKGKTAAPNAKPQKISLKDSKTKKVSDDDEEDEEEDSSEEESDETETVIKSEVESDEEEDDSD